LAPSLEEVQNEEEKKKSGSTAESLVALGVAAAAIGYIIWKRKQKQS
jgi:LPXTG-motif cell wall-anchored protein